MNIGEVQGEDASTTYIEPWNVEVLLKLAKVRTKRDAVSHPEYRKPSSVAYSESKTPELKTSFAMTVPKGLDVLSAGEEVRQITWRASELSNMPESFLPMLPGIATRLPHFQRLSKNHENI